MSAPEIFDRRVAATLVWGGLTLLMVTVFFLVFSDTPVGENPGGPDSYSRSALGYEALVHFLEEEVPMLISRGGSAAKAGERVPLLLLEPPAVEESLEHLRHQVAEAVAKGAPVVVVLPKWRGEPMELLPDWVERVEPLPAAEVRAVLLAVLGQRQEGGAELVRPRGSPGPWRVHLQDPGGEAREAPAPALPSPQLVADDGLHFDPLVATPQGMLVAGVLGTPVLLVADPDLLNTAGLARGDNAVLAHRLLLGHLRPTSMVIDESLHGYLATPSLWRALLEAPLLPFTLHLTLAAALVLWASTGRFGRPLVPPPRLPPGKPTLIESSAQLLGLAGRPDQSLEHYLYLTVHRAARRVALPGRPGFRDQVRELDRIARARGARRSLEVLRRQVVRAPGDLDARRALALARDLYHWRKEMMDATVRDPRSGA